MRIVPSLDTPTGSSCCRSCCYCSRRQPSIGADSDSAGTRRPTEALRLAAGPARPVLQPAGAPQQPGPGLADRALAHVEKDEDEEALQRVEDAEQDLHRRRGAADSEQRERPRQTCQRRVQSVQ